MAVGAGVVTAMQIGKVPPTLPAITEELELTRVSAGWVASLFFVVGALAGVGFGALADRFGERRLLFVGLACLAAGSLIGGLFADSSVLMATRVLEGVGYVAVTVAAPKITAASSRPVDVPLAISLWSTFMPLGMAAIMVVSPFLLDGIGWRGVWLVNAGVVIVFIAVAAAGLPPDSARRGPAETGGAQQYFDWPGTKSLMRRPGPWLLGLIFTLYSLQWFAVMTWLPTFLIETQGRALTAAALFGALVVFVNVIGNVGGGIIMLRTKTTRWALIAASFVVMAATVPLVFSASVGESAKIPLAIAFSLFTGVLPAACLAGAAAHAPSPAQNGMSNGFVIQGATIGSLLGPPVMGALSAGFGNWENFWWVMLIGPAFGIFLVGGMRGAERRIAS